MKKANISVSFEEEKLSALKLYLGQKGTTVEDELASACEVLYTKIVPSNVRDFIDLRAGVPKTAEKKKTNKPKSPVTTEAVQDGSDND